MSLRAKITLILLVLGVLGAGVFAVYSYKRNVDTAMIEARETADNLLSRSVEMFMVSTRKFHEDFAASKGDPAERQRVLDDWNRTIFAVDEAVIHDFGPEKPRVRLIGDERVVGYKPLGEKNTRIEIPFEREAVKAIQSGKERVEMVENATLRIAVPLWSDAHIGCAECHFSVVEGQDSDMSRHILLGTLNAYIPLKQVLAEAKSEAFGTIGFMVVAVLILVAAVYFFVDRFAIRSISRVAEGLNEGAEQVASASGQVSSASSQLSEKASQQAAAVEETSAALEQLQAMTKQNSANAGEANRLMNRTSEVVDEAMRSMDELTSAMENISNSSRETRKIIKTIDEIAFQTNLLALNAAVEAARAGESGAGFAVVADEVRNLALRAAEAAHNTAQMIEQTAQTVEEGSQFVHSTNESFTKLAEGAKKSSGLVDEIASASQEQSQSIDQVNRSIADLESITQQNAASAEETASASEEMNAQSEEMRSFVGDLLQIVSGSGAETNGRAFTKENGRSGANQDSYTVLSRSSSRGTIGRKLPKPDKHE